MRILGLILVLAFLVACEEKIKPSVVPVDEEDIPAQESWKSTVTFSDSAKLKAILWAGYIAVFPQKEQTWMHDSIHVDFFNEYELHTSVLTARRGRVNDKTRNFAAYDDVVVVSDSGTVLRTDSLFWNNETRKITTEAFVDIVSPTEHIRGRGLVSDQSLKNYRIFEVTGQALVKDE